MTTEILNELNAKWQQRYPSLAELRFCDWTSWRQRNTIGSINRVGVYILAKYSSGEVPQSVNPIDESVVYVGMTNGGKTTSLRKRLDCFDRAAFGKGCPHAGGYTYRDIFGTSQRGLYVSACPVYWLEEREEVARRSRTHSDSPESADVQLSIVSQVIARLEVCLRGLYVFRWGRLPKCNRE